MSIEHGVTTGPAKSAASGAAGHGHGKTKAGGPAAGGFADLLQNLGAEELPLEAGLEGVGDEARSLLPGVCDLAPAAAAELPALSLPQAPLALSAAAPGAVPGGVAEMAGASAVAGLTVAADLRAQPAGLPLAAVGDIAATPSRALPAARADQLPVAADAARDGLAEEAGLSGPQEAEAAMNELQPLLRQAALSQRMGQRQQAAEMAAQVVKDQRGEDIAARLGWQISDRQSPAGGTPQIVLAGGAADAGWRSFERRAEKAGQRSGGVGEVGAWSGPNLPDGPRMDVPTVAPDGGLMTEMRVAEQVSYWVGRGVQNAKLELEGLGLGEGSVQVSIALQGQEARVEFRTDQVQTRQVLEDSMPHLRELLAREGLVLSGMSVGTSGSDGAGDRQQQGRQERRQATVVMPELAAIPAAGGRGAALTGRSVDYFV